jgi:hypothetical protein
VTSPGGTRAVLVTLLLALVGVVLTACISPAPAPEDTVTTPLDGPAPATAPTATPSAMLSPTPATPTPGTEPTTTASPSASPLGETPSLVGDTRNAWAFAPVDDPSSVVVEGSVPRQRAWSTSKVLVAAAYLQDAVGGDPSLLGPQQREWVAQALGESDMDALIAIRSAITGDRGARMTAILRAVGDRSTVAPSTREGTMEWTVGEQVRFMAALARGEVVSPASSAYLLAAMQPVESQRWGLGGVGADAVKGGWLTPTTETRQMGLLDGYAVAVVTDAVGPAVLQSDGDDAHVEQMDRLAAMLADRLGDG